MKIDSRLVRAIPQNKLDRALGTGELQFLRILGTEKQGHHAHLLWLALRVGFNRLAGREDLDVLQHGLGKRAISARRPRQAVGGEDIDVRAGIEKSGDADDLVGTYGGRAHPGWNLGGQANARAFHAQITLQDGLFWSQRAQERMANHRLHLVDGARQRHIGWPVDEDDILRREGYASGQIVGRGHDLSYGALRKACAQTPEDQECHRTGQNRRHQKCD